ncbi:Uncharacterised protein [Mycobacteroides abscessus subsp. abscessus]|nr:Uncharacterised protein [Mycobacteroides abscessus subsp. abscessus]
MADRPTACSRRKITRSPMRSRMVSARPRKLAPRFVSASSRPGSFGLSGSATLNPALPGTDNTKPARTNGSSARKMKYPRSARISRPCRRATVETCRSRLVLGGLPRSPGGLAAVAGLLAAGCRDKYA